MVSGFVASVQRKEIAANIVVAMVRHSQRMNDPLVNIWFTDCRKMSIATIRKYSGNYC